MPEVIVRLARPRRRARAVGPRLRWRCGHGHPSLLTALEPLAGEEAPALAGPAVGIEHRDRLTTGAKKAAEPPADRSCWSAQGRSDVEARGAIYLEVPRLRRPGG